MWHWSHASCLTCDIVDAFTENKGVGVMKPGHSFTIEPMINEGLLFYLNLIIIVIIIIIIRLNVYFRLVKSLRKQLCQTQLIIIHLWCLDVYQRSLSEEVYSIYLPVLATVELWRGKKLVDFLPRHNSTVAGTGRRIEQTKNKWWRFFETKENML